MKLSWRGGMVEESGGGGGGGGKFRDLGIRMRKLCVLQMQIYEPSNKVEPDQ